MSNSYVTKNYLNRPVSAPASATTVVSSFPATSLSRLNFIVEVLTGPVVGTPSVKLQHSMGRNIWTDVKAIALAASTPISVTSVSMSTGELTTSAPHGLTNGTAVVLTGAEAPEGLLPGTVYFSVSTSATTVRLCPTSDLASPISAFSADGTLPLELTVVGATTIRVNPEQDAGLVPLKPHLRVVVTAGVGQTAEVVGVAVGVPY